MSYCKFDKFAEIKDFKALQSYLGLGANDNWLLNGGVKTAVSLSRDTLVFGHLNRLALYRMHEEKDETSMFTLEWQQELPFHTDTIMDIVCMSSEKSKHATYDKKTYIVVGLSSGHLLFYSTAGTVLFNHQFHEESVLRVRVVRHKATRFDLNVVYASCICVISEKNVSMILREIRLFEKQITNIAYKKLVFPKIKAADCVFFDHPVSVQNDNNVVLSTDVLTTGENPLLAKLTSFDRYEQHGLTKITKDIASRKIQEWLHLNSPDNTQNPREMKSFNMDCEYQLDAVQSKGTRIWLAPGRRLAAVADDAGRILIVDCKKCLIVRMFEGFKDAQCNFIEMSKRRSGATRVCTLFLLIYLPHQPGVSVFSMQRGPLVAEIATCGNGRFLNSGHDRPSHFSTNLKTKTDQSLFLDGDDSSVHLISVPFHLALTGQSSLTAKDTDLIRQIKNTLRTSDGNEETIVDEVSALCQSIVTVEMRMQCLARMFEITNIQPAILRAAIAALTQPSESDEPSSAIMKEFLKICDTLTECIDFYTFLVSDNEPELPATETEELAFETEEPATETEEPAIETEKPVIETEERATETEKPATETAESATRIEPPHSKPESVTLEEMLSVLKISESYTEILKQLLSWCAVDAKSSVSPRQKSVVFRDLDDNSFTFVNYLSLFEMSLDHSSALVIDSKEEVLRAAGDIIFNQKKISEKILDNGLANRMLLEFVHFAWIYKPFDHRNMSSLVEDMYVFNSIKRRLQIEKTARRGLNLIAEALVYRATNLSFVEANEQAIQQETKEDWSVVSERNFDIEYGTGFFVRIAFLLTFLRSPANSSTPTLPRIKFNESLVLDLDNIQDEDIGSGMVSEQVARWLCAAGVDPKMLIETENEKVVAADECSSSIDPCIQKLNILRNHFPFGLQSGVLLCSMTWEYAGHWSAHLSHLQYLEAAIICIETFKMTDNDIRYGVMIMIWNRYVKSVLEKVIHLIDHTGHFPDDGECETHIGFSSSLLPTFLDYCLRFLENLSSCLVFTKSNRTYFDDILINKFGPVSLMTLVLQQKKTNLQLFKLQKQMIIVFYTLANFNIKYSKPLLNIFEIKNCHMVLNDSKETHDFLAYLNVIEKPGPQLEKMRLKFLCKMCTKSVELIREDFEQIFLTDYYNWMGKLKCLTDEWIIDSQRLKEHQVIELYAHNWDFLAEDLAETVVGSDNFGKRLLQVALSRLHQFVEKNPSCQKILYSLRFSFDELPENMLLNDIVGEHHEDNVTLASILKLSSKSIKYLKQNGYRIKLASKVCNVCAALDETMEK